MRNEEGIGNGKNLGGLECLRVVLRLCYVMCSCVGCVFSVVELGVGLYVCVVYTYMCYTLCNAMLWYVIC